MRIPRDREVSDGITVETDLVVAAGGTGPAVPQCLDLTKLSRLLDDGAIRGYRLSRS